jgi:dTDP-4-amino-4,6-dideoxygalactose transaminase
VDAILSALEACAPSRSQARLEAELKAFLGVDHLFFVSSGKAALALTLQTLHTLRRVRRVLIPAYTCFSVPAAVIRAGLEPVLVDVDPATFDFEQSSLTRALDHRDVLCVIPTHLFGCRSDVSRVRALARPNVFLVEDAAQAFGLTDGSGKRLGSIGDAGVFSFGRGKHLTCGHAGMFVTSSPAIARAFANSCSPLPPAGFAPSLRAWAELVLMSVFIDPRLYWFPSALPFLGLGETVYDPDFRMTRLPSTATGALRRWLRRLERTHRERALTSDAWTRELGLASPGGRQGVPLLRFPLLTSSAEERTALLDLARRQGLGVSAMYPSAVHRIPELRDRFRGQRYPGAELLAARLVTLPTHRYVRELDRQAFRHARARIAGVPSRSAPQPVEASC